MQAGILLNNELALRFVAPLQIVSNAPSFVADTVNLRRLTASQKVQRWEITANIEPSNDSARFFVHSVLNNHTGIFEIKVPQVYVPKQVFAINVLVASNFVASQSTLSVTKTETLLAGEFIRFSNHDKIYMVAEDSLMDSSRLVVYPSLRASVGLGVEVLTGSSVVMKAMYDTDTMVGVKYVDGILSDPGSVKFLEAL